MPASFPAGRCRLLAATVLLCVAARPGAGAGGDEAVALIMRASGPLAASEPGGGTRRVATLDWLRSGTVLDCPAGATALVVLAGGRRYELPEASQVRVGSDGLEVLVGQPRELPSFGPLPRVGALSADARPGPRAGALRVRGQRLTGLYPRGDATTLAARTALRFASKPGIDEYHVEVEDEAGETVFHVTTRASVVSIPPEVLQPGQRYRWSVRGLSPDGAARGDAEFATLDAPSAASRERLRASLEAADDPWATALLAEVDRSLGLYAEAWSGFTTATARAPGDVRLQQALRDTEAILGRSSRAE